MSIARKIKLARRIQKVWNVGNAACRIYDNVTDALDSIEACREEIPEDLKEIRDEVTADESLFDKILDELERKGF